jgi:release factor glutamine methyltransferase
MLIDSSKKQAVHQRTSAGWSQRLFKLLDWPLLALRYRLYRRRYGRLALEMLDGVPLLVLPEVFNPVITMTGAFLVRTLMKQSWPAGPVDVLDLGTGSGVGAIFAARRGAQVKAVDINPEAVRCARINVLLNHLEKQVEVRQGDLFEPVAGERFDLVFFNPPFYRGQPDDKLDHAWRGETIFERFSSQLPAILKPNGVAWLVLSSLGDCDELLRQLAATGFIIEVAAEKELLKELITVYCVRSK